MTCSIRKEKSMVAQNFELITRAASFALDFSCVAAKNPPSQRFSASNPVNPFTHTLKGHYPTTAFKPYSVRPKEFAY